MTTLLAWLCFLARVGSSENLLGNLIRIPGSCYGGDPELYERRHKCGRKQRKTLWHRYGNTSWWQAGRYSCHMLTQTVLVIGDSGDTQLFHAIEHAVGQTTRQMASRKGARDYCCGAMSENTTNSFRSDELRVVSYVHPYFGGGAVGFCRDNPTDSLVEGSGPCSDILDSRRLANRTLDVAVVGLGRWRPNLLRMSEAEMTDVYEALVKKMLQAVLARDIRPVFRTLAVSNLIPENRRRAMNAVGVSVAESMNVSVLRLDGFADELFLENGRRIGLREPDVDSFKEVGPKHLLAAACLDHPGTAVNSSGQCLYRNEDGALVPNYLLLFDGTHWCADVVAKCKVTPIPNSE